MLPWRMPTSCTQENADLFEVISLNVVKSATLTGILSPTWDENGGYWSWARKDSQMLHAMNETVLAQVHAMRRCSTIAVDELRMPREGKLVLVNGELAEIRNVHAIRNGEVQVKLYTINKRRGEHTSWWTLRHDTRCTSVQQSALCYLFACKTQGGRGARLALHTPAR